MALKINYYCETMTSRTLQFFTWKNNTTKLIFNHFLSFFLFKWVYLIMIKWKRINILNASMSTFVTFVVKWTLWTSTDCHFHDRKNLKFVLWYDCFCIDGIRKCKYRNEYKTSGARNFIWWTLAKIKLYWKREKIRNFFLNEKIFSRDF